MGIFADASQLGDIIPPGRAEAVTALVIAATNKATADIEARAKARSRVDTGAMRNGWESKPATDAGDAIYGEVSNAVEYTIHNEYGTWKMSAQPMGRPALAEVGPGYGMAIGQILSKTING